MPAKKLTTIYDVIRELDAWMQHFVDWSCANPNQHGVTVPMGTRARSMEAAKVLEQTRNQLADFFGEPNDEL